MNRNIKYQLVLRDARDSARDRQTRIKALSVTVLTAALLFILAFWFKFPKIDPPLPESPATIDIDLTNIAYVPAPVREIASSGGSQSTELGNQESAKSESKSVKEGSEEPSKSDNTPTPPTPPANSGDLEKDPDAPATHQRLTHSDNTSANTDASPTKTEETKAAVTPARTFDSKNAFTKSKGHNGTAADGGTSKGTGGSSNGDEGKPNGDPNSHNKNGNGNGNGTGTGIGDGIGYDLGGRSKINIPMPNANFQKNGKVVVEITVDRNGKVLKARGGIRGSTITDDDLVTKCEAAAMKATFSPKPDAPEQQFGHITFNFKVK